MIDKKPLMVVKLSKYHKAPHCDYIAINELLQSLFWTLGDHFIGRECGIKVSDGQCLFHRVYPGSQSPSFKPWKNIENYIKIDWFSVTFTL